MAKFLISAHGRMASGIRDSLKVLIGKADQVEIFDAYVDETNVAAALEHKIQEVDEKDSLVLMSDIPGGSVNQIMMRYLNRKNTFLVTGISLALVVGLVSECSEEISEAQIEEVIGQSRSMMMLIKPENSSGEKEEDFF